MVDKKYDIIVYGATGFTGKLICEYLHNNQDAKQIKWAISGRNLSKLNFLADQYKVDFIQGESFDIKSLDKITKKAKLIISVVGPYSLYGKKLIESCVNNKCHYLDLTGEPEFVNFVEENFSKRAKDKGVILMNCCGFESIPPDLGVYYTTKQLKESNAKITTFLKTKGKISGGTWASFLNSFSNKKPIIKKGLQASKKSKKIFYVKELKKWALIFPVIDKHIVKKSAKSLDYGDKFSFNQYIVFKTLFQTISLIGSILVISILAKSKLLRKWLTSFIPSGKGPNKKERKGHWFELKIFAHTESQIVTTIVSGGDPGYGETAKFIAEMALCITCDNDKLNIDRGVITPAQCAGDLMIERLKNRGIKFEHKLKDLT